MSRSSTLGINYAKDSGKVIYNKNDLMIVYYDNLGLHDIFQLPPIKLTTPNYASSLRNSLKLNSEFKQNDILFEYDAFFNGIPTSGYNCNTAYIPFFGFNHEDSLVISESFAQKARHKYIETVAIPIYEYTLLQKIFNNQLGYFPEIGDSIIGDTLCASLLPQDFRGRKDFNTNSIKSQVINLLQSMNLSDLINMRISGKTGGFSTEQVKTSIENGKVTGFKIHKIKKDIKFIDSDLQQSIEHLYNRYNMYILGLYDDLDKLVNDSFAKRVIRQYYLYADKDKIRKNLTLADAAYVIELEISKEESTNLGDKMSEISAHLKYN